MEIRRFSSEVAELAGLIDATTRVSPDQIADHTAVMRETLARIHAHQDRLLSDMRELSESQADAVVNAAQMVVELERTQQKLEGERRHRETLERIRNAVMEETVAVTGSEFFASLVRQLSTALDVRTVVVSELIPGEDARTLRIRAAWSDGRPVEAFDYETSTPINGEVVRTGAPVMVSNGDDRLGSDPVARRFDAALCWAVPINDAAGGPIGVLSICHPVSVELVRGAGKILKLFASRCSAELLRDRAERELQAALHSATQANEAKTRFLAVVSHELRTPLTGILGFTDLLLEDGDVSESDRVEWLTTMRSCGVHLSSLIDDILEYSKNDSGLLRLECADCSIRAVVTDVLDTLRSAAELKGLELSASFDVGVPERVRTDARKVRQILLNLAGNSVKFTERGSVQVHVVAGQDGRVTISVKDTGIGIAEDDQRRIFDPFTQVDSTLRREHGGTGLGLTICRQIAGILGGSIEVSSAPGAGSTFTFSFAPVPGCEGSTASGVPEGDRRGASKRVLVVDDIPANRRLMQILLQRMGLDVRLAESGAQAIEMVRQASAEGSPHDLLVVDLQMPGIDGYEAARVLRRDGFTGPIIALTAHAGAEERRAALDAGCDDVLTKPVNAERVGTMIEKHVRL